VPRDWICEQRVLLHWPGTDIVNDERPACIRALVGDDAYMQQVPGKYPSDQIAWRVGRCSIGARDRRLRALKEFTKIRDAAVIDVCVRLTQPCAPQLFDPQRSHG
jgi:hypothetical protein